MIERHHIQISGTVQGIGFRPFVCRLAGELDLKGWVGNDESGVSMEIEGTRENIRRFVVRLNKNKPARANFEQWGGRQMEPLGEEKFVVLDSPVASRPSLSITPDLATCQACLDELNDPASRRYGYAFTNCTDCGPRYSIIKTLPYDRKNTSLTDFPMCEDCRREFDDPSNRRFQAQTNVCPQCGPSLDWLNGAGESLARKDQALQQAVEAIAAGKIVALKGIGGFQLLVDAANSEAVRELRKRKQRPHKPFALMYPDLTAVERDCKVNAREAEYLLSAEAPIVILASRSRKYPAVAPDSPNLGVMLPYSPLHHLLLQGCERPLVATSGNLTDEPICIENAEALKRLQGIADFFLLHDRPIVRALDDSIVRVMGEGGMRLRLARGYTPLRLYTSRKVRPLLALGGHMKNTVALARDNEILLSQHIGNLDSPTALEAFRSTIRDMQDFYRHEPQVLLHDAHPAYASTDWARRQQLPAYGIQHHVSHLFAAMAEYEIDGPVLGICWDGTGYGSDGRIWGGESFHWRGEGEPEHVATFFPFMLPGAGQAIREPRRAALGLLYALLGDSVFAVDGIATSWFGHEEMKVLRQMLLKKINTPECTSVGRFFDALAALLDVCLINSYEAQAAMQLEALAEQSAVTESFPFETLSRESRLMLDWRPAVSAVLEALQAGRKQADIASSLHHTLAAMVLAVARQTDENIILLSGGVFQNKLLLNSTLALLRSEGYRVYVPRSLPPNDAAIAVGQAYFYTCRGES